MKIYLYRDQINDSKLSEIAKLLNLDYFSMLLLGDFHVDMVKAKTTFEISYAIAEAIKDAEFEEQDDDYKKSLVLLCQWFDHNPDTARYNFQGLYLKKEKLLIDAIDDKESIYELMKLNMPMKAILELAIKAQQKSSRTTNLKDGWEASTPIDFGKQGETSIYNALSKHFNVQKDHHGRDFIIQGKDGKEYSLELKTISPKNPAVLSYHQFKKSVQYKDTKYLQEQEEPLSSQGLI